MAGKKIKCFIAMAFGKEDCDKIYDNQILPVLKNLDISPIRVDRKEHKDDLNVYIIKMLEEADFVIADLTYTRPSVYYEAGFGEANKPVAYTVRRDHLKRTQPDELRVHFDLQMKKIVAWSDPDDPTFQEKLKKRIKFLIKPIISQGEEIKKRTTEIKKFHSLSINDQCHRIIDIFSKQLLSRNFSVKHFESFNRIAAEKLAPAIVTIGAKKIDKKFVLCVIVAAESITQKRIKDVINIINYFNVLESGQSVNIDEYCHFYYFCSLKKIPSSRVTSVFPQATPLQNDSGFQFSMSKRNVYSDQIKTITVEMRLISPIVAEPDIETQALELISLHSIDRTNKKSIFIRKPNDYSYWYGLR